MTDREDKKCHICGNNHSLGSKNWTLAGHLCANRADRPNEWQMDDYIRKALALEQQNAELTKSLESVTKHRDYGLTVCGNLEQQNAELIEALEKIRNSHKECCCAEDVSYWESDIIELVEQVLMEVKG